MTGVCYMECNPRNFNLEHTNPNLFANSQWPIPQIVYIIYRVLVALFFVIWIVLSGAWDYGWHNGQPQRIKWFIYLTNWALFTLCVSLIVHATVVIIAYMKRRKQDPILTMTWYYKATWVLYNLESNGSVTVSILFWALIWTPGSEVHPVDWNTHGTTAIFVLIDLFINGIPVRIHHFFHGAIFTLVYLIFTIIYDFAGGLNSFDQGAVYYPILDWSGDPATAAVYGLGVGLIGCIVIWCVIYGIYWIRMSIYGCAVKNGGSKEAVSKSTLEMTATA